MTGIAKDVYELLVTINNMKNSPMEDKMVYNADKDPIDNDEVAERVISFHKAACALVSSATEVYINDGLRKREEQLNPNFDKLTADINTQKDLADLNTNVLFFAIQRDMLSNSMKEILGKDPFKEINDQYLEGNKVPYQVEIKVASDYIQETVDSTLTKVNECYLTADDLTKKIDEIYQERE